MMDGPEFDRTPSRTVRGLEVVMSRGRLDLIFWIGVLPVSLLIASCGTTSTGTSAATATTSTQSSTPPTPQSTTLTDASEPTPFVVAGIPSDSLVASGTCDGVVPEVCSSV